MSVYQVLVRPKGPDRAALESGARFISEGFSFSAALLTPLWAIVHGLWLELVIWIAALVVLIVVNPVLGEDAVVWLYLLSAVLIGFEAGTIRAAALSRRGWRRDGDIIAEGEDLAEQAWIARGGWR